MTLTKHRRIQVRPGDPIIRIAFSAGIGEGNGVDTPGKPVERLFPFVLRAGVLIVGRELLWRLRKKLQFVLVTTDLSENSLAEIRRNFATVPILQRYTSAELENWFGVRGTKVIGLRKSGLSHALFKELKLFCIQKPAVPTAPAPGREPSASQIRPAPKEAITSTPPFKARPRRTTPGPHQTRTRDATG